MSYYSKYNTDEFNEAISVINNSWLVLKIINLDANTSVRLICSGNVLNGVSDSNGTISFNLPTYGIWNIIGVVDESTVTTTQTVSALKIYTVDMSSINDN